MVEQGCSAGLSGQVVALLSAESKMVFRVDRAMAMVFVEVPGRPCSVLLGFTAGAAVRFAERLLAGFEELCADRDEDSAR